MTTDAWIMVLAAVGAALLGVAAVAAGAHRLRPARGARVVAVATRGASVATLLIAAALASTIDGSPSLFDARLVATGLGLAASAIHLAFALAARRPAGVWPVDLLVAGVLAVALLIGPPGGVVADCAQRALPFFVEWALYLFGSGALLVAAVSGAATFVTRGGQPSADRIAEQALWVPVLLLAFVALSVGLLVGTWWAWQTTGTLLASDQRQLWMALAWLVAGMALVAGEMEEHADRWIKLLTLVAASLSIFGLLVLPDLLRWWGG